MERPFATTPRVLWIELTSKCPFDCVFCSRKLRRGAGRHLPFPIYRRLVESLVSPRKLVLNYSGESLHYPDLAPAIELGRAGGAFVELVTALASIRAEQIEPLAAAGLGRLTVSIHATDPKAFAEIYRYSSFAELESSLRSLMAQTPRPAVDFAFVAMRRNLDQLEGVADFAERMGIRDIMIFPVMRRDPIPEPFFDELEPGGAYTAEFRRSLRETVTEARRRHAAVSITISNPAFDDGQAVLGETPLPCPDPLPAGASIHGCEQNPWETAHVLSNGDVVACEALDKIPLGNLFEQSIGEIWRGGRYQEFRRGYPSGEAGECRRCVWKRAFRPGPLRSEILARDGASPQLLHGWHEPAGDEVLWSTQEAAIVLRPRAGSRSLHVSAMLPPGPPGDPNELVIACNGRAVGRVPNPWEEIIPFGLDFPIPEDAGAPWQIEFRTRHMLRPSERGLGPDTRDLGFALMLAVSKRSGGGERQKQQAAELAGLRRLVDRIDRLGTRLRQRVGPLHPRLRPPRGRPGISILIPERDQPEELAACLAGVARASERLSEPVQVIVAVNGTPAEAYGSLRRDHPRCEWLFSGPPLGFGEAVRRGLRAARFDWVYLLNNDAVPDPDALRALLPLREAGAFAIASQIFLKDPTRYREETNWTVFFLENGLAAVHDRIPAGNAVAECFYAGGGASLFQRRVLAPLVAASGAYAPFYWEDVEWSWRARKRGYRVLFCPQSVVRHRQRATIAKHYAPDEIESVIERNRLLFQLRNLTAAGSLDRLFDEMACLPEPAFAHFRRREVVWSSARVRLWNHLSAREDREILS